MLNRNKIISVSLAALLFVPSSLALPGTGVSVKAQGTFNAADYGAYPGDNKSDTDEINSAIRAANEAGGGTVVLSSGEYNIKLSESGGNGYGLEMRDNVTLQMDKNTKLVVEPSKLDNYQVLRIKWCNNVTVSGGRIIGEKNKHSSQGEADEGHGIVIADSTNISIIGMNISNNWGDGIYIGNGGNNGCNTVKIKDCTITGNRRNNIAIVDADNVTIDKCVIKNAKGAAPQCGILIEPNTNGGNLKGDEVCKNITIKNTTVKSAKKGNKNGQFMAVMILNPYYASNNKTVAKNVTISKCTLNGDCGNYSGKKVSIKNSKIKGTFYDHMKTKIKKTTIKSHYKF